MTALVPFRYMAVKRLRAGSVRDCRNAGGYCTKMVTTRRYHLYIAEWMEERGLSDEQVAEKVGRARETVTRWRSQQHRLNPQKIATLAAALDVEPEELWRPPKPERPSVDTMLKHAPDELVQRAAEMATILLKTGQ